MWEAAAAKITERGGRILMGRELVALAYDEVQKFWRMGVATADGKRENYTARHIVSSAPVRELVQQLTPKPISLLNARELRYRDFITVALMIDRPDVFDDNWIYIHDPSVKVGRVQNFASWSPDATCGPASASTTSGRSTRTPNITKPARRARRPLWPANAWYRSR